MIQLPMSSFALIASQDVAFQVAFSVVVFLVLNAVLCAPAVSVEGSASVREPEARVADPEEDYLPLEYQKPSPTPAEMEAFCRWSGVEVAEWQESLYDGHRLPA